MWVVVYGRRRLLGTPLLAAGRLGRGRYGCRERGHGRQGSVRGLARCRTRPSLCSIGAAKARIVPWYRRISGLVQQGGAERLPLR